MVWLIAFIPSFLSAQIYTVGSDDGFSFACAGSSFNELLLPVSLHHFEARCTPGGIEVSGSFTENHSLHQITPEKSMDGKIFYPLPVSMQIHEKGFVFMDLAFSNQTRYYRLKKESKDKPSEYSHVIAAKCAPLSINITPNPASGFITIHLPEAEARVVITDIAGKRVFEQTITPDNARINLHHLKFGLYQVAIDDGHQRIITQMLLSNQ